MQALTAHQLRHFRRIRALDDALSVTMTSIKSAGVTSNTGLNASTSAPTRLPPTSSNSPTIALFNRNVVATGQAHVDGRTRRHHHKPYTVVHGVDRQLISADLVRHVAIGGDPVRADDHPGNTLGFHDVRSSGIGIESDGDAFVGQLPRRQSRTLQPWAGFIGVNALDHAFQ